MTQRQTSAADPPRVLVVDDHADFREAIRLWLELHGFAVITATNGAEGLAAAENHAPDAILMDVSMPVLDGVEATTQLKASSLASIPVVGFTAQPLASLESRARAAGMVGVFAKQGLSELIAVLRDVVSNRRSGRPLLTERDRHD